MSNTISKSGIASDRLNSKQYPDVFTELHAPLSPHEALVEAGRCYFCYDAPCQTACPTDIDIALFIRQISTQNPLGAAKTIFNQNILGGMCARVCPTETLCEEVCVREEAEGKPVKIGFLQRYATDNAMEQNQQFFKRAAATGKTIAIIGAGPASIACAHRLAMFGHKVKIFEAREKPGGLNEYGIAAYKTVDDFAQKELDYILQIGGISFEYGVKLGSDISLDDLAEKYAAIFIGVGLGAVNALGIKNSDAKGVVDAVDFIEQVRQSKDLSKVKIGRDVIVIGGGMTAIDAAIQAKLLGAQNVTICYRRGPEQMGASKFEQDLATSKGVMIRHWLAPKKVRSKKGAVKGLKLEFTRLNNGKLEKTGEKTSLNADQIFVAIGQKLDAGSLQKLQISNGRIKTDEMGKTSLSKVWAGGDCIEGGEDLTVTAVANGRDAAESINAALS